jgi:hypothetical protein
MLNYLLKMRFHIILVTFHDFGYTVFHHPHLFILLCILKSNHRKIKSMT